MINRFHPSTQPLLKRELMRALFLFLSCWLALCCCAQAQLVLRCQKRQRLQ